MLTIPLQIILIYNFLVDRKNTSKIILRDQAIGLEITDAIRKLVAENKIEDALDLTLAEINDAQLSNELVLLQRRYKELERKRRMQLINNLDYQVEMNQIIETILQIISE